MMELVDVQDLGSCGAIRVGSSPTARTTSEQAAYRLLRLFPKAECARCAAPPFKTEPASLGFDLVLGTISKEKRFYPLIADQKFPPEYSFRLAAKTVLWWGFFTFGPDSLRWIPVRF